MPSFIDNLPIKPMSFQAIEQEALFFCVIINLIHLITYNLPI